MKQMSCIVWIILKSRKNIKNVINIKLVNSYLFPILRVLLKSYKFQVPDVKFLTSLILKFLSGRLVSVKRQTRLRLLGSERRYCGSMGIHAAEADDIEVG